MKTVYTITIEIETETPLTNENHVSIAQAYLPEILSQFETDTAELLEIGPEKITTEIHLQ